ncbi:hypothetical protein D3C72_2258420 [compost metagenome]
MSPDWRISPITWAIPLFQKATLASFSRVQRCNSGRDGSAVPARISRVVSFSHSPDGVSSKSSICFRLALERCTAS